MVQQEVKKKTRVYGTIAILSAMILVSLIYVFGSAPGFAPISPITNPDGTPTTNPDTYPTVNPAVSAMKTFASYEDLRNYLNANSQGTTVYGGGPLDQKALEGLKDTWEILEQAIHDEEGVSVVAREKCIGCGLCVTGCPDSVPQLLRRPEAEMIDPPADFATWERERLRQRGLLPA